MEKERGQERGAGWGAALALALGAALVLAAALCRPAAVVARPIDTPPLPTVSPHPTGTPPPASTHTPLPTGTPGGPPATPALTPTPRPTGAPPLYAVDIAAPVPPEPIPAPWVGVADFLRGNVCVRHGDVTRCQGDWVVNTIPSLYESRDLREDVRENLVSEGDKRPTTREDDVHIARPQCLVGSEWWYVRGTWYYNGLADVVVEAAPYASYIITYRYPEVPREEEFDVLVRVHRAYVPEPAYPGATAWNFGADYTCEQGGGGEPPPPPPPPPPTPSPPPAGCPSCAVVVSPTGTLESPALIPGQVVTLTWQCSYPEGEAPAGYILRVWAYEGSSWGVVVPAARFYPGQPRRYRLEIIAGLTYRATVTALFTVEGREEGCCTGETYLRHSLLLPPGVGSLEARLDYWSERDRNYPGRGPGNPYRTAGSAMLWNYGEVLHAHPSAEIGEPPAPPKWTSETRILRWRYLGSTTSSGWHAARCAHADDASCAWQEEGDPRQYIHLRWYKYLRPGEEEGLARDDDFRWVYASAPITVTFSYEVGAATTWTHESGQEVTWEFTETLTMTVDLQYLSTSHGDR